ncbi:hypothetical protein MKX03_000740 [Papaver bracteatum]|nr:hypothetical protein MKX03_000740 [Papaver bracteatum]
MNTAEDVDSFLLNLGLKLRVEWLNSCLEELHNSMPGFCNLNVPDEGKHIMQEYLFSNMNTSCDGGGGGLTLPGPFVLQVDEIFNINVHPRKRHKEVPAGKRCLKLSMTDGVQRVFGFEDSPIEDLQVLSPSGLKVIVCNVHVGDGLLVLVPESLEVLGGMVEDLEAVHKKLVEETNGPLWRKRMRTLDSRGTTIAAWKPNGFGSDNSTLQNAITNMFSGSSRRPNIERNPSYNLVREIAVDNSHRLTGDDEEIPLRYLDDFLSDWEVRKMDGVPFIQTKIRCIITGVNNFKFENRTEYELTIPVFDGSRLCYSPEEINAAGVNLLDNIGKRFEAMFLDFRGTMLVEMNKYSTIPVVLEINDQDQDDLIPTGF